MAYSTTESDLRTMFEAHGPVAELRVIGDQGFASVAITAENAAAAIEDMNGKEPGGRTLTVNEARPRAERTGGGGGGYGGGSGGGYGGGGGGRAPRW